MIEQLRKKFPYCFLLTIFIVIVLLYFAFVKLLILDLDLWPLAGKIIFLIFYHLILIMLLWSIIESFKTDPGRVPHQWGFTIDSRDKKYCLICHVFKPQRTHHCSACNRCVLNMDHHCPWINNCIGFYNRKAFILMNIYTTLITFMNILAVGISFPSILHKIANPQGQHIQAWFVINLVLIFAAFIFNCIVFVTIANFLKFHLELILRNFTTLETLELKRQGKDQESNPSQYDIGNYYNWVQVFGRNQVTWPIPIFLSNQGPSGDGVIWPKSPQLSNHESGRSGRG